MSVPRDLFRVRVLCAYRSPVPRDRPRRMRCMLLYAQVMACDAKLNFDDNAEWRQPETFKFRDYTQEDTREAR